MSSLKVFGVIALIMIAGVIAIPALAQQTQKQSQTGDCICDCDGTCDSTCDGTPDKLQKRTQDCSCDGSQTMNRSGIMKQDRDRVCTVGDFLKTQQQDQLRTRNC